jgi:hypothetical protein
MARFTPRRPADEVQIHAPAAADVNEPVKAGLVPVPVPEERTMQGEEAGKGEGGVSAGHIRDELQS